MRYNSTRSMNPLIALWRLMTGDWRLNKKAPTTKIGARVKRQRRGLLKPNEKAWHPRLNVCLPPRGMTSATAFGPIIGPVGSITWLPATAHSDVK